jgi:hypothetical protein
MNMLRSGLEPDSPNDSPAWTPFNYGNGRLGGKTGDKSIIQRSLLRTMKFFILCSSTLKLVAVVYELYMAFFISRRAAMTSTGSVLPVFF